MVFLFSVLIFQDYMYFWGDKFITSVSNIFWNNLFFSTWCQFILRFLQGNATCAEWMGTDNLYFLDLQRCLHVIEPLYLRMKFPSQHLIILPRLYSFRSWFTGTCFPFSCDIGSVSFQFWNCQTISFSATQGTMLSARPRSRDFMNGYLHFVLSSSRKGLLPLLPACIHKLGAMTCCKSMLTEIHNFW